MALKKALNFVKKTCKFAFYTACTYKLFDNYINKFIEREIACAVLEQQIKISKINNDVIINVDHDKELQFCDSDPESNEIAQNLWNSYMSPSAYKFETLNRIVKNFDKTNNINIVMTTSGGSIREIVQFCETLKTFKGIVRVFVPDHAYSCGTILSLTADELYMTQKSELSAINTIYIDHNPTMYYDQGKISLKFSNTKLGSIKSTNLKYEEHYRKLFNTRYNIDLILNDMMLNVKSHDTCFSLKQVKRLTNDYVKKYDGDHISVIKKIQKIRVHCTNSVELL